MTNREFGLRTGYDHSFVSRLRHGQRLPSYAQMLKLAEEFDLDLAEAVRAAASGGEAFAALLAERGLGPRRESPADTNHNDAVASGVA